MYFSVVPSVDNVGRTPQVNDNCLITLSLDVVATIGQDGLNLDTILAVCPEEVELNIALACKSIAVVQVASSQLCICCGGLLLPGLSQEYKNTEQITKIKRLKSLMMTDQPLSVFFTYLKYPS